MFVLKFIYLRKVSTLTANLLCTLYTVQYNVYTLHNCKLYGTLVLLYSIHTYSLRCNFTFANFLVLFYRITYFVMCSLALPYSPLRFSSLSLSLFKCTFCRSIPYSIVLTPCIPFSVRKI